MPASEDRFTLAFSFLIFRIPNMDCDYETITYAFIIIHEMTFLPLLHCSVNAARARTVGAFPRHYVPTA